jgi:hypothetical protein
VFLLLPRALSQDEATLAELQVSFINYVVSPLWSEFAAVFPFLKPVVARMNENKARFAAIVDANAGRK